MACFIDRHRTADIDPTVRYRMHLEALQGLRDSDGAKPLSQWIEDGTIYCLLDAEDVETVCRHHAARGVQCNDIHQLQGVSGNRPLSSVEQALVRNEIARIWHTRTLPVQE